MVNLFAIIAVVLVILGIMKILAGAITLGVVLVIIGLCIGPGGVFYVRR